MKAHWGFASAVLNAYNYHANLVIRPDDVWQAVLSQFSYYVKGHSEELRSRIVDFEGK